MKWTEALALGKTELAKQAGAWPSTAGLYPKIAAEQAAGILKAADDAARAYNVPWDWFYPAMAILGYRVAGDRFRIDEPYAQSILPEDVTVFFWDALSNLASKFDTEGRAVPASGGAMTEAFFGRKDGNKKLTFVALSAWAWLQKARAAGDSPTWLGPFKDDGGGGKFDPQGQSPIIPPALPDKPPFQPPLPTVPRFGGGDILVWVLGFLIVREILK